MTQQTPNPSTAADQSQPDRRRSFNRTADRQAASDARITALEVELARLVALLEPKVPAPQSPAYIVGTTDVGGDTVDESRPAIEPTVWYGPGTPQGDSAGRRGGQRRPGDNVGPGGRLTARGW